MFIPNDYLNTYKKNDVVILLKDIGISYGIFTKGHLFIIDGEDGYGYIMKDIENDIVVKNIQCTDISLNITHRESKVLHIKRQEKYKLEEFCKKNCPNKEKLIDDRDYYDACKLGTGYINICKPKMECIIHIDDNIINKDDFMSGYLRRLKIDKLINK